MEFLLKNNRQSICQAMKLYNSYHAWILQRKNNSLPKPNYHDYMANSDQALDTIRGHRKLKFENSEIYYCHIVCPKSKLNNFFQKERTALHCRND